MNPPHSETSLLQRTSARYLPSSLSRRARAFTLIEILVVVAIIAILAAIAFPVAGGMLDRGADAQDVGNLRQIGLAMSAFASENNNRWPNVNIPIPNNSLEPVFMEHVDRQMDKDPRFSKFARYNFQRRPLWFSKRFAQMPPGQSYNAKEEFYWGKAWGMNVYLWGSKTSTNSFQGNILKAPDLSKLVLVGEKNRQGGNIFDPRLPPVTKRDVSTDYRVSRPGNKAYYLFGDYHVESIEGDQSVASNPHYDSYNPTNRLYYRWWRAGQTP